MRISARHVATVTAVVGVMIGSVAVAEASMPTLTSPSGPDSGDLSTSPSTFFVGDTITIIANFSDSQSGNVITFYKETSPGSGQYDSIGTKTANSSGNGSLTGYTINETQKIFARTSAGKETEVDTLTPKTVTGDDGVINACFDRDDGELSILIPPKSCTSSEKALSWNSKGIQGEKGEKGDKGDQGAPGEDGEDGAQGPAGPAGGGQLFSKHDGADHTILGINVAIFTMALPAGKYAVTATAMIENRHEDEDRAVNCGIPGYQTGTVWLPDADAPGHIFTQSLTMVSWIDTAGGNISIVCTTNLEATVWVVEVAINAMKVDSIT